MTSSTQASQHAAVWFVVSEQGEPLGQLYRGPDEAEPVIGASVVNGAKWRQAEVVESTELRSTCRMRRFSVVLKVVE